MRQAQAVEPLAAGCYLNAVPAPPPPEVFKVKTERVYCDGSGEVDPALGHPRIYLRMDAELGYVECGYCDRRFVLEGGPADSQAA